MTRFLGSDVHSRRYGAPVLVLLYRSPGPGVKFRANQVDQSASVLLCLLQGRP